jgi:hypothetical protein
VRLIARHFLRKALPSFIRSDRAHDGLLPSPLEETGGGMALRPQTQGSGGSWMPWSRVRGEGNGWASIYEAGLLPSQ